MRCSHCGNVLSEPELKQVELLQFEGIVCTECWVSKGEIRASVMRNAIAHRLAHMRQLNERRAARLYLESLRGTGVPTNPHHKRKAVL